MTDKNYSIIVTMKNGDQFYCTDLTRQNDDVILNGQYKDGNKWSVETTRSEISSIKRDISE